MSLCTFVLLLAGIVSGCNETSTTLASTSQPIVRRDGGFADGGTSDGTARTIATPRPPVVRTAADVAAFLAEIARRSSGGREGTTTQSASLSGLLPRTPHPKRTSGWACADLTGPSVIRFKFIEGTGIRLNQSQQFVSINPGGLDPAHQAELNAINALTDPRERAFDQTNAELLLMKEDAEKFSGEEMPDLTLWFDLLVNGNFVNPASGDGATCAAMQNRLAWLLGLSIVETARPMYASSLTVFPSPPPSTDIAPVTATAHEPPHMGPFPGLDSPLFHPRLNDPGFIPGWRGEGVAMVDIENNVVPFVHEKVNATILSGGELSGDANTQYHSLAAMSTAYGTAFSGNNEINPRYGTRGFAPNAARGFSPSNDTCFVFFTCSDIAEATIRAADQTTFGDVIWYEVALESGSLVGQSWGYAPVENEDDTYDAIRTVSGLGRVIIEPAGNDGQNIDPIVNDEPNSGALLTGANDTLSPLGRIGFSNFGTRLALNGWGTRVWHANSSNAPPIYGALLSPDPGTNVLGQQYRDSFAGTSSASAVIAGALAQYSGVFRQAFGHPMGRPGFDRAQMLTRVAAQRGTAISNLGVQPEVVWTVSESILVTRIPGCGTTIRDPHASDAVITIPSGTTSIFTPWSFTGCAYTATVFDSPGATVTEMEFGSDRGPIDLGYNPDGSFTIEANVVIQPDFVWQGIVVKESPRNYGLWVTPSTWPSAGTLHFSYHPVGSSSLCPFYGNTRIDDGLPHHVAVRFDRRVGSTPLVSFFVDGVLDGEQFGCTTTAPLAGGGSGANILRIGSLFRPGSLVGNVRLFHRYVEDDEISFHVSTGAT